MYYAETLAEWRHQVKDHDAPELALPGLNPTRSGHRECHQLCRFDTVCLDFVSSYETAWLLAEALNLGLAQRVDTKGGIIL